MSHGTHPTGNGTMQAIVQDRYGSADSWHLAQVARPGIKDDEVLLRVHAAGLDRGTWHLMVGKPYLLRLGFGLRGPRNPVPGRDVAGTVAEVGSAVTRLAVGDEVYGVAPGSFAEYAVTTEDKLARKPASLTFEQAAVVPISGGTALQALTDVGHVEPGQRVLVTGASGGVGSYAVQLAKALGAEVTAVATEDKLARKPANLTFEQAAVVPISGGTALQALTDVGRVEPGQKVLVIGASGGVGSYAVQLAKAFGAEVTAVCSTAKLDLVRSLGADHVVDYTRDDYADGSRYDLVLDIAGRPALSRLRRALSPTGTAVLVGGEEGGSLTGGMNRQLRALVLSMFVRQRLTMFVAKERASDLELLTPLLENGTVVPSVDRAYPLDQAPEAMRHLEAGLTRGKIAITV